MRVRGLTVLVTLVVVLAACSGSDETRAEAGGRLGSAEAEQDSTVTEAGSTDTGPGTEDDRVEEPEDQADDDPEDPDPEELVSEELDSNDRDSEEQEAEPEGDGEDAERASGVIDDAGLGETPLTGPGSATESTAMTLVPVGQGDSGNDVEALQTRLAELGFAPGTPDGSYGRRTVAAVEAFQSLVDLEPTGDAAADTITALVTYRYDGLVLHAGDEGAEVEELQLRLTDGPFDPGGVDGSYGTGTVQAVWALEKLAGIPVDGDWGPLDEKAWEQLTAGEIGAPVKSHDERWVEVDLSQQLMKIYDPDSTVPTLISHASSGSGIPWENEDHRGSSITPVGDFHINRRISGWRESSLNIGRLYNPLYFNGGIAFHGATSVPLHPASHGCIRLPMHVADYLPEELPNGTPVHVLK